MSHEITSTDHMFSRGETPWHTLGTVIPADQTVTSADAMALALPRLDGRPGSWDVVSEPALVSLDGRTVPVPGYKVIVRDDNREPLAIMTNGYRELSNVAAFRGFDPWVTAGVIRYETAGSLRGGRRVWILARVQIPDLEIGTGDTIAPYVLLAHGHDGSLAIRAKMTAVRVVCANTLAMSLWDEGSTVRAIRHTGNVEEKAAEAIAGLDTIRASADRLADRWRAMAATKVDRDDIARFVAAVWQKPIAEVLGVAKKLDGTAIKPLRAMAPIADLFETPRGRDLATTSGTAWGMYQAVTAYLTHGKADSKRDPETRFDSVAFNGDGVLMERAEVVADLLAVLGIRKSSGFTWADVGAKPTTELRAMVEAKRAA